MAFTDGNQVPQGRESGAALLVIVAILAIIAGLFIGTRYYGGSTRQKAQTANVQVDVSSIGDAIGAFWGANSRLPCPADISLDTGVEAGGGGAAACSALASNLGTIPWKTLGIPKSAVRDPWGNYMSYQVDNNLVITNSTGAGTLIVKNTAGGANIVSNAIIVIISFGPNGNGAYTGNKVQKTVSTDADELENADGDTTFVKGGTPGGNFDDILIYWTWA